MFFSVMGPYRVRIKVRVSVNYYFIDFLLHKVGFTAYSKYEICIPDMDFFLL